MRREVEGAGWSPITWAFLVACLFCAIFAAGSWAVVVDNNKLVDHYYEVRAENHRLRDALEAVCEGAHFMVVRRLPIEALCAEGLRP